MRCATRSARNGFGGAQTAWLEGGDTITVMSLLDRDATYADAARLLGAFRRTNCAQRSCSARSAPPMRSSARVGHARRCFSI
jgi:hypothetical protein